MSKPKEQWEFYGENDPYFAVSTFDKFKKENLNEESKNEFFRTGEEHFIKVWEVIEKHFVNNFKPANAIDFGCGVGRLVIPLSARCENVIGIDISQKMLEEAKRNCEIREIKNTDFYQTEEFISKDKNVYDFIHSFIVFQHINPEIGEGLIELFTDKLRSGGIGVLHFTYFNPGSDFDWTKFKIYRDYPTINRLKNLVKGTRQEPFMPMYLYDLNRIMAILQKKECHNIVVKFSNHGFYGTVIFFQKDGKIQY